MASNSGFLNRRSPVQFGPGLLGFPLAECRFGPFAGPFAFTVGSLFAGIGGFDLGLERTGGFQIKWQVEIDEYCQRVLARHWPNARRYGDIRTIDWSDVERVDVLCGGFPCQDISNAGKREGITGERSGLWAEFARAIGELRPRYVLVENVAALLGRGMGRVLGDISTLRYDAEWDVIRASDVGAPHRRERVWIVAYPGRGFSDSSRNGQDFRRPDALTASGECGGAGFVANSESQRWNHGPIAGNGGSILANAYISHGYGRRGSLQMGRIWGSSQTPNYGDIAGIQWRTEPNVGRVAHGVPLGLEFIGGIDAKGNNSETDTKTCFLGWQVLRAMWEHRELATTSPYLFCDRLRDIVPDLPYSSGLARWIAKSKTDQALHHLWQAFHALPFQEAQHLQSALLERGWQEERIQAVAFRKQRVDRLKGLGNAVVPQIVTWIGERILEWEASHV